MKVDIIISADDIKQEKIEGRSVLVIDMLRATSVITTAMMNGCKAVIPVLTVERALEIAGGNREAYILGGERRALRIEGFDCSNSPLEYTPEVVRGKTLIMTTTNGTRAIDGCRKAENILIGCMLNALSAAKKLVDLGKDIVIVNAGTYGQFSMDDFICSGYIIECLKEITEVELSDIAWTSNQIYNSHPDIISFIRYARHYNVIKNLGLEEDLEYCIRKDITDMVPVFNGENIE
ncbi:MAG: 2-phosphosulfolactate phosphatase family protein [Bacillota bacterium]|nr:2-phosphosulfolactate phosphatase family protein [Bacillota bacterium]